MAKTEQRCAFCSRPATGEIKTGVSAYVTCAPCSSRWEASDHTLEALNELRAGQCSKAKE